MKKVKRIYKMNYLKYIKLNQNKTKNFKIIQFFLEKNI